MFALSGRFVTLFSQYETHHKWTFFISSLGREKVGRSMDTSYKYSEANHRATPLLGKKCIWCECKERLLFISHHLLQIESHQGGSTVIIHSTMKPHHQQEVRKYLMLRSAINLLLPCTDQQWFLLPHPLLVVSWWPEVVRCNYFSFTYAHTNKLRQRIFTNADLGCAEIK